MPEQLPIKSKSSQYPKRKNMRLSSYDYSSGGYYFATICTHERRCIFGEVIDGGMILNSPGRMVAEAWVDLPRRFNHITLDLFVVMPNHIHGILILNPDFALETP